MMPLWDSFLSLLFPDICVTCDNVLLNQEQIICTECYYHLPVNDHHLFLKNQAYQRLYGKVPIQGAWAYLSFVKSSRVQKLIHRLKYQHELQIGEYFGMQLGKQILSSPHYREIDLIVPVPIHKKKRRKRGYNQSELIADGVAKAMAKPINKTDLIRIVSSESQTKKHRLDRYENVSNVFTCLDYQSFQAKHILLVDDVLTTGATLAAAAQTLLNTCDCEVSIATLAIV